ncbi:MAG: hypothetical protein DRG25_03265 [Deltaproteobacteria bacterium]|nr:MAG: hypothetical protein DRG25_03265 [Deltaproteobacteria bacterium]
MLFGCGDHSKDQAGPARTKESKTEKTKREAITEEKAKASHPDMSLRLRTVFPTMAEFGTVALNTSLGQLCDLLDPNQEGWQQIGEDCWRLTITKPDRCFRSPFKRMDAFPGDIVLCSIVEEIASVYGFNSQITEYSDREIANFAATLAQFVESPAYPDEMFSARK